MWLLMFIHMGGYSRGMLQLMFITGRVFQRVVAADVYN